jgi:hypothetical protein
MVAMAAEGGQFPPPREGDAGAAGDLCTLMRTFRRLLRDARKRGLTPEEQACVAELTEALQLVLHEQDPSEQA